MSERTQTTENDVSTDEQETLIETPPKTIDESLDVLDRLTDNVQYQILPQRYLVKDDEGNVVEEPENLFERVAKNIAVAEAVFMTPDDMIVPEDVVHEHVDQEPDVVHIGDTDEYLFSEENAPAFSYDGLLEAGVLDADVEETMQDYKETYQHMMETQQFIPNSPTLMNAGTELQQLSACFVSSPQDSMDSIGQTVKDAMAIFKSGGGLGYAFHELRPYGAPVSSTGGQSSGPISYQRASFMDVFDTVCGTVEQGGKRRGAQMGIMRVDHADIGRFAVAKRREDDFNNFNISVGVTDEFIDAVRSGEMYTFYDPQTNFEEPQELYERTKEYYSPEYQNNPIDWEDAQSSDRSGSPVKENFWRDFADEIVPMGEYDSMRAKWEDELRELFADEPDVLELPAQFIWDIIIDGAWRNGEPGLFHYDETNRQHSFDVEEYPEHKVEGTNPCAEQPLSENEACNLGHINLSLILQEDSGTYEEWKQSNDGGLDEYFEDAVDMDRFNYLIENGVRFLDNVVTMSDFPIPEISKQVSEKRKIGLGVMGWAQLLFQMGIEYGSEQSYEMAEIVMGHINSASKEASKGLARERGVFDAWDESKYANPTEHEAWFKRHVYEDPIDYSGGYPIRNHNTTTVAPTGCVEEDSLIATGSGLQSIDELSTDRPEYQEWESIDETVVTEDGVKAATAHYNAELTDVKTITTEHGFTVSATPNHRFRTLNDDGEIVWKEAASFDEGDIIVQLRDTFVESDNTSLDVSEREAFMHNTDDDLHLPAEMTPELAQFLGYWMGDGYTHDGVGVKLVVSSDNTACKEHLISLSESVFGVTPTIEERDSRTILTVGGRHLPRYFEDNGWVKEDGNNGEGAASAFVPTAVRTGTRDVANAFLSGLFEADGTVSRKVELSTVSETLSKQVQSLLASLGHLFVRDETPAEELGDDHYGDRTRYTLRGANKYEDKQFVERIGTITKDREITLTEKSYRNDVVPNMFLDRPSVGVKSDTYDDYVHTMESLRTEDIAADGGRDVTDYIFGVVSDVRDDLAYTQDISVPSNTQYTANTFISHNTTSMVGNTTGGIEPLYNVANFKNVGDDIQGSEMLVQFDDYFLDVLEANDIDTEAVKEEAQELMQNNEFDGPESLSIPDDIARIFVTTNDLSPEQHGRMQRHFQQHVDSGISKTVNLPNDATREDVAEAYQLAVDESMHGAVIKGLTVYRDGSRSEQVLTTRTDNKLDETDDELHATLEELYEAGELTDTAAQKLGLIDE